MSISSFSCLQYGRTAVLLAALGGHLDLVRELVEQHGADLLHKSSVSSASFCVRFRLSVTSVMCTCHLCGPSISGTPVHIRVSAIAREVPVKFYSITSVVCMDLYSIVHCTVVMVVTINPRVLNDTYQTRRSQEVDMKT